MRHGSPPSRLLVASLALAVLVATGCASAGRAGPVDEREGAAEAAPRATRVIVENESGWSLRVYALVGGSEHYLGTLDGYGQRAFQLPKTVRASTANFRLAAKAVGPATNYYSDAVIVQEGDTVVWTVMRSFSQTRGTIRVS